jgi:hypothetical protein
MDCKKCGFYHVECLYQSEEWLPSTDEYFSKGGKGCPFGFNPDREDE